MNAVRKLQDQPGKDKIASIKQDESGTSGTCISGGMFDEDHLPDIEGSEGAEKFDKMYRTDPKVKMILSAINRPLLSSPWEIEAGGQKEKDVSDTDKAKFQEHAQLVSHILFNDMKTSWIEFLREALTMNRFGYSLFDITHKVVQNHPRFGTYNGILRLGWRSQKTIEEWTLDPDTGDIITVRQCADGDLGKDVDMDGEFLLHFAVDKEGDNYEGVSLLGLVMVHGAEKILL